MDFWISRDIPKPDPFQGCRFLNEKVVGRFNSENSRAGERPEDNIWNIFVSNLERAENGVDDFLGARRKKGIQEI